MTDLHLTPGAERIIGLDPLERFMDGLRHASQNHSDAERLILTGDLTHYGDEESYQKLKTALYGMPWPVSFLLGNHDDRSAFKRVFLDCPCDQRGFVQSVVDLDGLRLITLDTLDTNGAVQPHAGHLCSARLDWLRDQLLGANNTPCLVFLHHPPIETGFVGMDEIRLQDDHAFWCTIPDSAVAHVFAGHVHRTITSSANGIPVTIFKSTCHQMPMLLGAPGAHHSVNEPGSYGIILSEGPRVVVHFEDFPSS